MRAHSDINPAQMRCLITGASGFIGKALVPHLRALDHCITEWPRHSTFDLANKTDEPAPEKWITQLEGVDAVIHLAGLAHQPRNARDDARYFQINRDGTLHLAAAAKAAGVKRFIFISTAKVFGEGGDLIYTPSTQPNPEGAYAQSKLQAEQRLLERFSSALELVIIRPPLVYGRDAKANFAHLMMLSRWPIPLPFAGIHNRRAMIGINNLIDLIATCLTKPSAAGNILLCADAQPYSLADIVTCMRHASNRDPNLFHLPRPLLNALKKIIGHEASERLFGDFQMDCAETFSALDWKPPFTMQQILHGDIGNHL